MESSGVPKLRLAWSIQTKKSGILVSSTGDSSKEPRAEGPGRPWRPVEDNGSQGRRVRNLHLPVTLQAVI